jgi:2-octaprenyl-6-methoxyphenol hydroxylase
MAGDAKRDVVIGGAGFAGLALAIALRQALGEGFAVTVADPALGAAQSKDPRASAIAAAASRLFEAIEVWDAVADEAQPMLDMVVTDSKLENAVRPTFLTFGGEVEEGEPFAHMIENRLLVDALVAKARALGVDLRATAVKGFANTAKTIDVGLADGSEISARLLVGADGARSSIREQAGIASHGWNYDQSAIVCTVAHERDHHGRAGSTSCRRDRSRSCRSPASAARSCGPNAGKTPSASSRCPTRNSTTSWRSASACSLEIFV